MTVSFRGRYFTVGRRLTTLGSGTTYYVYGIWFAGKKRRGDRYPWCRREFELTYTKGA